MIRLSFIHWNQQLGTTSRKRNNKEKGEKEFLKTGIDMPEDKNQLEFETSFFLKNYSVLKLKKDIQLIEDTKNKIIVKSGREALGKIAQYWKSQSKIPLVAITGSNGKTTTKEMIGVQESAK